MGFITINDNINDYVAIYEHLRSEVRRAYADCNTLETGHRLKWKSTVAVDVHGWESIMESALEFEAGEYNDFCVTNVAQFFYDAEAIHHDELLIVPCREEGVACSIRAKKETLDYIKRFARTIDAKVACNVEDDLRLLWN